MSPSPVVIAPARLPDDLEIVRALFVEYMDGLGIDLSFQNVDDELAGLPGKYAPPTGTILLARDGDGNALGCIALRPTEEEESAEIKRLYVRPGARGHKLGSQLATEIMSHARSVGYRRVVLDTLVSMHAARNLYASLGFKEIAPYYDNPMPEAVYLGREL